MSATETAAPATDLGKAVAGVAALPLRNRGGDVIAYALVDADLYPALSIWRWSLSEKGYVVRSESLPGDHQRKIRLHRVVMGCAHGDGLELDHINRNPLDNRRSNLRYANRVEQAGNRDAPFQRPAYPIRKGSRWQARCRVAGERRFLGSYTTFCDALRALQEARTA